MKMYGLQANSSNIVYLQLCRNVVQPVYKEQFTNKL